MSHRWNRKTDANQKEIVAALRAYGATVHDASAMGQGFPDLVVGFDGKNYLIEIKKSVTKTKSTTLNSIQQRWHDNWKGTSFIVTTPEEAVHILDAGQ